VCASKIFLKRPGFGLKIEKNLAVKSRWFIEKINNV
jgi:hypothetical protein